MKWRIVTLCACAAAALAACRTTGSSAAGAQPVITGSPAEQYAQGMRLLLHPSGALHRPEQALPWLRSAAAAGLPNAQAILGLCLQHGWGAAPDEEQARAWYMKAAEQGQSGAAVQLAKLCCRSGSPEEAAHWLELALAKGRGTPDAHVQLALLCLRSRQERKAVTHLRYAAMDGSAEAAYLMALCYAAGAGVSKNEELMLGWLRSSAELDYPPAKLMLKEWEIAAGRKP